MPDNFIRRRLGKNFPCFVVFGFLVCLLIIMLFSRFMGRQNQSSWLPGSCLGKQVIFRDADLKYRDLKYHEGELDSCPAYQEGTAHFYGGGEPLNYATSSGEVFEATAMAAASWFYPLGTRVRVTDLSSNQSVIVVINDRGPNRVAYPEVIIDLTRGAMQTLAGPGVGRLRVAVEPVG